MQETVSSILENVLIADGTYKMTIEASGRTFTRPGQFAMVNVREKFLRRPISVSSYDSDRYTLIYRVVGEGTRNMSLLQPGEQIDVLTGLGNGYNVEAIPDGATIVGGGIGIPPMLGLVKELLVAGKTCRVVLGFNTASEVFMEDEFKSLASDVIVMTRDGSYGSKGLVTDALADDGYVCACGPIPMLRALAARCREGQFSLEARMGCGFGACMGCSIRTSLGAMRVCKEGPVFDKNIIDWEELNG